MQPLREQQGPGRSFSAHPQAPSAGPVIRLAARWGLAVLQPYMSQAARVRHTLVSAPCLTAYSAES